MALEATEIQHSRTGASGSHRWMNCHGSVNLIREHENAIYAEGDEAIRDNEAADLGTAAHELARMCLVEDQDTWEHFGETITARGKEFEVDKEMADCVQLFLDVVRQKLEQHSDKGAFLVVEQGLRSDHDPDAYGTPDAVIYVPDERILVFDYKHGYVIVEPNSSQLRYYGHLAREKAPPGTFDRAEPKVVELRIVQPRPVHVKGPVRVSVDNPEDLEEWFLLHVIPAIQETRNPKALLKIGPWCGYCPAKGHCPAIKSDMETVDLGRRPETYNNDELGEMIERLNRAEKLKKDLKAIAFVRMKKGQKVKWQKLVRPKGTRAWKKDADKALVEKYGDDAYMPRVLRTPPNVEDNLPGGSDFVIKNAFVPPSNDLTMAPESDSRPEVRVDPQDLFSEIDVS